MRRLELLPILLIAFSSESEKLGVGIAYGMRNIAVPLKSSFVMAAAGGVATLLSMLLGQRIAYYMPTQLATIAGGGIIVGFGVWTIVEALRSFTPRRKMAATPGSRPGALKRLFSVAEDPASADRDSSGEIDVKEVWLLAIALSLNNVTNGIGSGMVRLNPVLTAVAVMIFSMVLLWAGLAAGHYGERVLGSFAGVVSGVLLIAVGIYSIRM